MRHCILGCGDIGRRIVRQLLSQGEVAENIAAWVASQPSFEQALALGVTPHLFDLDSLGQSQTASAVPLASSLHEACAYYTVAPQRSGSHDQRSRALVEYLTQHAIIPSKLVLISTTGVYGDAGGEWVDETCPLRPTTERAIRRHDAESVWQDFMEKHNRALIILRVPGIYARSRLPEQRIEQAIPVVRRDQVGFTNRIHADDLAAICVKAMQVCRTSVTLNASDGKPGTITDYLQAVAQLLGGPPLPEITLEQAQRELSPGMLSYLSESRKISNAKLLETLDYQFLYPDFRIGMQY